MKALTFVEVDIEVCSLAYGVAPCTATLAGEEPTGTRKCFNTKATCQDRPNFATSTVTLRFAMGSAYLVESGIEAIACIESADLSPGTISLGEDLGTRSSLRVTFSDFPWPDTGPGYDPYVAERPYDPFVSGTYWGKFRARQPYLRGRAIRLIQGFLGQTLAQMETRHFILESFEGPSLDGRYSLVAKDALKMADDDRALAPKPSNGFLIAEIDAVATSATLSPVGIGNAEYPASGIVAIGGKEICTFTRAGDVLTLTRGQFETDATEHDAQDRVQLCLFYEGVDPAQIIADLLDNYAGVPGEYIPLTEWLTETSTFLRRVYTALIAEPTGVNKLVSELVQQAQLAVWWDDVGRRVRLQVLRQIATDAALFDDTTTLRGTLRVREQPAKRASQVWVYYGQINALKKVDDADNYRSAALTVDLEAEGDYGGAAIKKIYGRWIPAFGRQAALRLGDIHIGRFRDAPRRFSLGRFRDGSDAPILGRGYRIGSRILQLDTGEPDLVPVQIVRLNPTATGYDLEADELRFVSLDEEDLSNRVLIVDANELNINFRDAHDALYPEPVSGDVVTIVIEAGVIVGSSVASVPSFITGDWPSGVTLKMILRGRIQGAGGPGNSGAGGVAFYGRHAIEVTAEVGSAIWGGGGGGATWWNRGHDKQRGGGGGQGYRGGPGGAGNNGIGQDGSPDAAGLGATGGEDAGTPGAGSEGAGAGGLAGQAGKKSTATWDNIAPGAGGAAIDGLSYITLIGSPDIRGTQIN